MKANCASVFLCFVVASVSIVCTIVLWCSVVESVSIVLLSTTKQRNTDAQLAIIIQWYYSRCFVVDRSWLVGTATDSPHWTSLNFFSLLFISQYSIDHLFYFVFMLTISENAELRLRNPPWSLHCNCPKLRSPSSRMWSIIWLWDEEEEEEVGEIFILCRPVTPYLSPSLFVIELSPLWTIIRLYFSSQGLLTSNLLTFDTSEICFLIDLSSVLSCAHKCKCALSGNL